MNKIPPHLFRFFKEEKYALAFIKGKVRFGSLRYYRYLEDERADKTEGLQFFKWENTKISHTTVSIHEHYILCTSGPEVDIYKMIEKFESPFVVRIDNPYALFEKIKTAWNKHSFSIKNQNSSVDFLRIQYNKGGTQESHRYYIPPHVCSQKPLEKYEDEKEFRYILKCRFDKSNVTDNNNKLKIAPALFPSIHHFDHDLEDHLVLTVANCSSICSLQN